MSGSQLLEGVRILDLSRLAPGPFGTMLLADFGADVILVEPPGGSTRDSEPAKWELERHPELYPHDALRRGKKSIVLNLKQPTDRKILDGLIATADVLIEGFRPGVAARLGADAEHCRSINETIVHCSIVGYRSDGPNAQKAGHDINYLAENGILAALSSSRDGRPTVPMNIIADFAGGGLYAALSICAALLHRERTGQGQSIEIALEDGALSLMTYAAGLFGAYREEPEPLKFFLSGGLPHYNVYKSKDDRWFAVGALEPWFFQELCRVTAAEELAAAHGDASRHDEISSHLEAWFSARSSDEIERELANTDACVSKVLSLSEALAAAKDRGAVISVDDVEQVAPAPRFSLTPALPSKIGPRPGQHGDEIKKEVEADGI